MHKIMKKTLYIFLTLLILFSSFPIFAREQKEFHCAMEVQPFAESKTNEFSQFMNQHFSSKKQTSDLIEMSIKKFREYVKTMRLELAKYPPAEKLPQEAVARWSQCEQIINDQIFVAKEILKSLVIKNAHAKKTTKLLDKYKEINSKLDRLNFQMAQMYGYLQTFSQKLPCYVPNCN